MGLTARFLLSAGTQNGTQSSCAFQTRRETEFRDRDVRAKHLVNAVLATRIWVLMLRISLLPILTSLEGRARRTGQ